MELLEIIGDTSNTVFWHIANVFALIAIFDGSRRMFQKSYSRSSIIFVVFGFSYCMGISGLSFYLANTFESLSETSNTIENLPEDWGKDLAPEDREKKTKIIASVNFKQTGALGKYVDVAGEWQSYCPSENDVLKRTELIDSDCQIRNMSTQNRNAAWYWIVSSLIAVCLGFIASHKKLGKDFGFAR